MLTLGDFRTKEQVLKLSVEEKDKLFSFSADPEIANVII